MTGMDKDSFIKGVVTGKAIKNNEKTVSSSAVLHYYLDPAIKKNRDLERGMISDLVYEEDYASWKLVKGYKKSGVSYYSWGNDANGFNTRPFRIISKDKTSVPFRVSLPNVYSINGKSVNGDFYIEEYKENGWETMRQYYSGSNFEVRISVTGVEITLLRSRRIGSIYSVEFVENEIQSSHRFPPPDSLPTNKLLRFQISSHSYAGSSQPGWPPSGANLGPYGSWGSDTATQFSGLEVQYSFRGGLRLDVEGGVIVPQPLEAPASEQGSAQYDKESFLSGLAVGLATEGTL